MTKKRARMLEELYSSGEGPSWRWKIAQESSQKRFTRHTDALVQRAAAFLRRGLNNPVELGAACDHDTDVAGAIRLNQEETTADLLQVLTLGQCEPPEIAQRLGLEELHVLTWERLFFDVRGAYGATSWVEAKIIRPLEHAGRRGLAARLRLVYSTGPVAARALMDADVRMPLDPGQRLFAQRLKLDLKFQEALAFPVTNERQSMQLTVLATKLRMAEKKLELERAKLEARCQEAVRKHEFAVMRVEAAREKKQIRSGQQVARRSGGQQAARLQNHAEETALLRAYAEAQRADAEKRALASPLAKLTWFSSAAKKSRTLESQPVTPADSEAEVVKFGWGSRVDAIAASAVSGTGVAPYRAAAS